MRPSGFSERIDATDLQLQRTVADPVEKLLHMSATAPGVDVAPVEPTGRIQC
jgi:hypothetical protein